MDEQEYREFRRRALSAIGRSVVRDPPTDGERSGEDDGRDGPGDAGRKEAGGDGAVTVRLHPAVRAYLEAEFEDRFGEYEPQDVAAVVPVESGDPDTSATVPLEREEGEEREEGRLLAYRTVRADLLAGLADHAEALAAAVEVHDALERLVGERGPPTDRRPGEVVAGFLDWVADARGERAAAALQGEFTVLHVMRIAPLYRVGEDDRELPDTVREWLSGTHPEALDGRDVVVER